MNIEECADLLIEKMKADMPMLDMTRFSNAKDQRDGLIWQLSGLVKRGGKLETARYIWVGADKSNGIGTVRLSMDVDDPEEVDVPERETVTVD